MFHHALRSDFWMFVATAWTDSLSIISWQTLFLAVKVFVILYYGLILVSLFPLPAT